MREIYQAVTALSKRNSYFRVTLKNISSKCIILIAGTTSDQEKGSFYNVFLSSYRELLTSKKRLNFLSYSLKTVLCSHHCSKQRRYKSESPSPQKKTKQKWVPCSFSHSWICTKRTAPDTMGITRIQEWRSGEMLVSSSTKQKKKNVYPPYTVTKNTQNNALCRATAKHPCYLQEKNKLKKIMYVHVLTFI